MPDRCVLVARSIDSHAGCGVFGGRHLADAMDAGDEVIPVLEAAFGALLDDARRNGGANALDAAELGGRSVVDVDGREAERAVAQGQQNENFFEHGFLAVPGGLKRRSGLQCSALHRFARRQMHGHTRQHAKRSGQPGYSFGTCPEGPRGKQCTR